MDNSIDAMTEQVFRRMHFKFAKPESAHFSVPVQFKDGGTFITISQHEWESQNDDRQRKAVVRARVILAQREVSRAAEMAHD